MSETRAHGSPSTAGLTVVVWLLVPPAAAGVNTGTDAEAQLPYWEIVEQGVSIRLVQRLPEQTRGFFVARGFSGAHADRIALSCVFQTVFKNIPHPSEPSPVEYNLRDWVVRAAGAPRALRPGTHTGK